MEPAIEQETESIIQQVRRLKEENAAEHGFDVRAIAVAAQKKQRQHPERMVSRIPKNAEKAHREQPLTRSVPEDEL